MNATNLPICVIEDNNGIRKLFCTLLNKGGYQTIDFSEGKTALKWLEANPALAVLIDILLPDINGTDIFNIVSQLPHYTGTPFIAVTGFAQAMDKEKYIELGFKGYLSKPVNIATFVQQIKDLIYNS
ncbi:MAG: response regulator [FCB group bacterium]|jgi:two-component system cell cycle response regulator DivK